MIIDRHGLTIGRLNISSPIWGFEFDAYICGCHVLCTPLGSFTWFDKTCRCLKCDQYICGCK